MVLVVEDEPLILLYLTDFLENAGFEAIAVSDTDIAIDLLSRRNDIQIVLTDINIPGSMDGLKLAFARQRPLAAGRADHHFGSTQALQ